MLDQSLLRLKPRRLFQSSPLNRSILRIVGPAALAMVSQTAVMIADQMMVSSLGKNAQAAAGAGSLAVMTVLSFVFGGMMGVQILTARRFGQGDRRGVGNILVSSLYFASSSGLLLSLLGYTFAGELAGVISQNPETVRQATGFLEARMLGLLFFFLTAVLTGFFDGLALTKVTMVASFATAFGNIFLNWVLIHGNLGAPALGMRGAGAASTFAGMIGALVFTAYLLRRDVRGYLGLAQLKPHWPVIQRVVKISFAPGLEMTLTHGSLMGFYAVADQVGVAAQAATAIVVSIMSASFMVGYSFSIAATTILGQAMGAGKLRLARMGVRRAAVYGALFMTFMGLMFLVFRHPLMSLYSSDPAVLGSGATALAIVAFAQFPDAYHMTMSGALRSAGLVYWVMIAYAIISFGVMLPASYILAIALGMGTAGLWIAILLWMVLLALAFTLKFNGRGWERGQV